ncbi:MAG TPA: ADP-ribosylglycohydrolase family protein [Armatimonadota bacterium]|jgi:ADP-ribosylglycohydrolase
MNQQTGDFALFDAGWVEGLIRTEFLNRSQQGYELDGIDASLSAASGNVDALWTVYEALLKTVIAPEYPYTEPNDLAAIRSLRPHGPRRLPVNHSSVQMRDRVHGALLGRVIGVILGRPVEGLDIDSIRQRLESTGDYPLADYFRRFWTQGGVRQENGYASFRSTREGLRMLPGAEPDDDLNYVMINLRLLEKYGAGFTTMHAGYNWLESFPVNWAWGPERTAYLNLARYTDQGDRWRSIEPEALWRITHHLYESSELIGAQIRADVFGYVLPGKPELAAEWAWRDGALTHVKNGIYGEMLFAAAIAAAFVAETPRKAIEIGLSEIPDSCRLAEAVRNTLTWWDESHDWQTVYSRIAPAYNKYQPGGTINNACIIVNALLSGAGDFEQTMAITVMQGQDTDCTGGTAGSIIGAWLGGTGIPAKWSDPLADTFETAIPGEGRNSIRATAERIQRLSLGLASAGREAAFRWDI